MTPTRGSELTVALVRRALSGDRQAIRRIVDGLTPVIQARAARSLLRRGPRDVREEVKDITQIVLLRLFEDDGQALRRWDPARGLSLENFVGLRAEHEVVSILRSRARNPWTSAPTEAEELDRLLGAGEEGPEARAASRQELIMVLGAMRATLGEQGRELLEHVLADRAVEDVCRQTGMSAAAVHQWRSRLARLARRKYAELMSETDASRRTPRDVPALKAGDSPPPPSSEPAS